MQEEPRRDADPERPEEHDATRAVNPAARHDESSRPEPQPGHGEEEKAVPPVQEEPLDPLGPGGIGA